MKYEDYTKHTGEVDQQDNYRAVGERINQDQFKIVKSLVEIVKFTKTCDLLKKEVAYGALPDSPKMVKAQKEVDDFIERSDRLMSHLNSKNTEVMKDPLFARLFHYYLGILTESGEMLEALLKYIEEGKIDLVNLSEEHGDNMWYLDRATHAIRIGLETSMEGNYKKLNKGRYANGYSDNKATNRDLNNERKILESSLKEETNG